MTGIPPAVADCLVAIATQGRSFAYCQVTPEGHLMSWGGALATYGLQSLAVGELVSEHFFFLEGFFPLAAPYELLPSVQTPQGLTVDVHLLLSSHVMPEMTPGEQPASVVKTPANQTAPPRCGWIVLLDATAETQRQQQLQQKGNDLSLLRSQYAKLLRRTGGAGLTPSVADQTAADRHAKAEQAAETELETGPSLRSQEAVSVLVVDLYELDTELDTELVTDLDTELGAGKAVERATAAFSLITQCVTEEGGWVNHVFGTTMVVLFGVMPGLASSAQQALSAASKLLTHYTQPPAKSPEQSPVKGTLRIGMAITTGKADTGWIYIQGSKMINAVGPPIQKALVLSGRSHPDTLVVDKATLQNWQKSEEKAGNALKYDFFSQALTTHHNSPDFRSESLELYELTLTDSSKPLSKRKAEGSGPLLSQPPP